MQMVESGGSREVSVKGVKSSTHKISAGIIIRISDKVLLCHDVGKPDVASYTPPKGGVDPGETPRQAAIRETLEEVGIKVDESRLSINPLILEYTGKNGRRKMMYLYEYHVSGLHDLGIDSEVLPKSMLQEGEIDWAGFVDRDGAKEVISPVFWPVFHKQNDH